MCCPPTAKLTSLIERPGTFKIHEQITISFKLSYFLTECWRFHTSIQNFKSIHQFSIDIFYFSKDITGQVIMVIETSIDFMFLKLVTILASKVYI